MFTFWFQTKCIFVVFALHVVSINYQEDQEAVVWIDLTLCSREIDFILFLTIDLSYGGNLLIAY